MKSLRIFVLLVITMLVFGCRSTKTLASKGEVSTKMTAKELIRENQNKKARFKTLQARVKLDYTQDNRTQSYTVNLRMEKDKIIWLNSILGLARVMITPDRVSFYDKINNQYFDGDYRLLSELLGVELNFQKVENLLLGEAIYNLRDDQYKISTHENSYVLEPKEQQAILELFFLFNPGHFKVDSQQLFQASKRRFLEIDYKSYQKVSKQIFPENLKIIAVEDTEEVIIEMEYRSVTLNEDLRFPFKIPSGFKEITFEYAD